MPDRELLFLALKTPLPYSGLENPPLSGLPTPEQGGSLLLLADGGSGALPEGGEELFAYDEEGLFVFDPEEGPRAAGLLPSPRFYGRSEAEGRGKASRSLPAGRYLFFQLRPRGEGELLEALEWFAREAWWERQKARGPYFIRRVQEDGHLATQILRRLID